MIPTLSPAPLITFNFSLKDNKRGILAPAGWRRPSGAPAGPPAAPERWNLIQVDDTRLIPRRGPRNRTS